MALKELIVSDHSRRVDPSPHHRSGGAGPNGRRVGSVLCLRGWAQQLSLTNIHLDQPAITQTNIQDFELAHHNIHPIYDLPGCVKGLVLWSHNHQPQDIL